MLECPHCQVVMQRIEIVDIPLTRSRQQEYHGVAYTCPGCGGILGVAANPFEIRDEIAQDVLEKLKSWATGPRQQ
jgi:hypothetical protein